MAQNWPSGPSPASYIDFRTNFTKATLIPSMKQMFGIQSGPSWTTWGPEMAQTWPSGQPPASDINNRTYFMKATLILNIKLMLGVQSGPSRTMWGPEMAQTWPSGAPTASDIDFRTKFTIVTLIPNKNGCLEFSLDHLGPLGGWKWPKLGHLDHLQPQISILGHFRTISRK